MCACSKVYYYRNSLDGHIRLKTISYTCPYCSKVVACPVGFKRHLENQICRNDISYDDDDDDDDEMIIGNKRSSESSLRDSPRKSPSRSPPTPSNSRGIVIIITLQY